MPGAWLTNETRMLLNGKRVSMTAEMWCWTLAMFFLGVLAGGLVWIPMTIKRQQAEFAKRIEFARRVRESDAR
jgi:hypothetical protein